MKYKWWWLASLYKRRYSIFISLLNSNVSIEGFVVELNLRKNNGKRIQLKTRYHNRRTIDVFSSNCINILLLVGFNVEPTEQPMKDFCIICNCKNTIGDKTVIRTPKTQSAIDLIMTNIPKSFQNWQAMKTGKSDFHKTSLVVLKFFYTKLKPNITQYRRYQKFSSDGFINGLQNIFFSTQFELGKLFLQKQPLEVF